MSGRPGKNPYRPGVGTKPAHLAGRDGALRRFEAVLRGAPDQPANLRLTGLRGVGKTVLLAEFADRARKTGWSVAALELGPRHAGERALVDAISAETERARHELSRAARVKTLVGRAAKAAARIGVSYGDIRISLESSDPSLLDLGHVLYQTLSLAVRSGGAGLLLLLDEAQTVRDEIGRGGQHPLSLLLSCVSALQRTVPPLPVGLVVCGLPTLGGNLLRARSYSERMFRGEEIGRLEPVEARAAFIEPLRGSGIGADERLVSAVVDEVEGYPYFIQLWGAELWDAAAAAEVRRLDERLLRITRPDIHRRLDIDFYEPRISTLRPAEQDLVLATVKCPYPPLRTADLVARSDKRPTNLNVVMGRLVEAGVVYRLRRGEYDYTAPKFRDYLLRREKRHG